MLDKPIEQITLDDLQRLIDDEVPEGKTIEYKRDNYRLDSPNHDDRAKQHKELLKDVSSFANTMGGHLIIGIQENQGIPTTLIGITESDADKFKLKLTQIIEKGLEPRISFAIHAVKRDSDQYVLVIQVLRSLIAPHRVVYGSEFGQFWARNSAGAYQMDTSELRQSFTMSEVIFDRIKRFRVDRTHAIMSGETPVPMPTGAKLILHLIPLESFSARHSFAPADLEQFMMLLEPLASRSGWTNRFNVDGFVTFDSGDPRRESFGYVQLFRSGMIEVVADDITYTLDKDTTGDRYFRTHYELYLVDHFPKYLECQGKLGITPPMWCFLTLAGVKGVRILRQRSYAVALPIDRDILYLPEAEITDLSANSLQVLKPLFDMIWNAAGYPKSFSFNSEGEWSGS